MESKRFIYFAGFITLFGLGGVGVLLLYFFHDLTLSNLFCDAPQNTFLQLGIGILYAIISSGILIYLLQKKMLDATRYFFARLMKKYTIDVNDILFLSFCAGVGEELLFRGTIQPWLGIWLTALLFIFLHGYLNPKDKPLFIYGTVLLIVSAGFGYLMQASGIIAAITSHFIIDVVLMLYLKRSAFPNV